MKKNIKKLTFFVILITIVLSSLNFSSFNTAMADEQPVLPDGMYLIKNLGLDTNIRAGSYCTVRTSFGRIDYYTIEEMFTENTASTPEATGSLLWYIKRDEINNKYSITAVGLRPAGEERFGAYKLSACSAYAYLCYNTPQFPNSFEISVTQNGNIYTGNVIENNSNTRLSASSSNVYFFSEDGINDQWEFTYIDTARYNFFWEGTYNQGIYNGVAHVKILLSDDLLNSNLFGETFGVSRIQEAVTKWNGISENVIIYGPNDSFPNGITPFYVTITTSDEISVEGVQGDAFGVMLANGDVNNHSSILAEDWNSATIVLNDYDTWQDNPFLLYETGSTEQLTTISAVITHEVGHALKLSHPNEGISLGNRHTFEGSVDNTLETHEIYSVMNSGSLFEYTINGYVIDPLPDTSAAPQAFDIINPKSKWEYHNGCNH